MNRLFMLPVVAVVGLAALSRALIRRAAGEAPRP
jgi:hypothetical protein